MVNRDEPRTRRRRLDPSVRRTEILDAAETLLRRDGAAVRAEDIARAAGVAKGTVFAYFATWEDLLAAVRERQVAPIKAEVARLIGDPKTTDWDTLLPAIAVALVDGILALEALHEVLFHSDFARTRPLPEAERPTARIAALIHAGQAAGAYAPLDPEPTATLLFAAIHETADAIAAGAERDRAVAALRLLITRTVHLPPLERSDRTTET